MKLLNKFYHPREIKEFCALISQELYMKQTRLYCAEKEDSNFLLFTDLNDTRKVELWEKFRWYEKLWIKIRCHM